MRSRVTVRYSGRGRTGPLNASPRTQLPPQAKQASFLSSFVVIGPVPGDVSEDFQIFIGGEASRLPRKEFSANALRTGVILQGTVTKSIPG